jgi:hypothetical protein
MSKFNENIRVTLHGNEHGVLRFYAFKGDKNPLESFFKRLIYKKRFTHPVAVVEINKEPVKRYVHGQEVPLNQLKYYGPGISSFKLKIILNDDENTHAGPFYSNGTIQDLKEQYKALLYQYLDSKYRGKWISAIIMDIRNDQDKVIRKLKYDFKNKKTIKEL